MKLFDGGRAPNPRRVRIFLAEKGLSVPLTPVDMGAMEHRNEAVTSRNPLRRLPVLELDDGTVLTETVAICRYFEELHPEPALFGTGALGKALVEMWQRRMEFNLFLPVHRRRQLHHRRHHRAGGGGFHETGPYPDAGRLHACAALASGRFQPAKRRRLRQGLCSAPNWSA